MTISRKQIALFWVAVGKLNLTEEMVRTALVQIAGVTSAKDLDQDGFTAMMGLFEHCGFQPLVSKGPNYGDRPGMATFAQIEFIRTLWSEYTHGKAGEDELNKWLMGTFKISSLRFLRKETAQKAITALKSMKARRAA